jgi:hypothetical protein
MSSGMRSSFQGYAAGYRKTVGSDSLLFFDVL